MLLISRKYAWKEWTYARANKNKFQKSFTIIFSVAKLCIIFLGKTGFENFSRVPEKYTFVSAVFCFSNRVLLLL